MSIEIWAWLIALIGFGLLEGATAQLVSVWFIGGSFAALMAAIFGAPFWLQVVLFFSVSAVLLLGLRPVLRKSLTADHVPTNADRTIGMTAIVTEPIDNIAATGRICVDGKDWAARSEDGSPIEAGEQVIVRRMEGVRLYVERQTAASAVN